MLPQDSKNALVRSRWLGFGFLLVPFAIYVWRSLALRGWIVDDAAISFAFARTFSLGQGLAPQVGAIPVEGYSNPLWVFAMSPFFLLGVFDPYITPKLISTILVGITFWQIHRCFCITGSSSAVSVVVITLLALNTSLVVWTSSGLENALLAALVASLLQVSLREIVSETTSSARAILAGLLSAAIALTRPEGIVLSAGYPIAVALGIGKLKLKPGVLNRVLSYLGALGLLWGGYLLFRRFYFGDWVPNTYYVKGGPTLADLGNAVILYGPFWSKWQTLISSFLGARWWLVAWALLLLGAIVPLFTPTRRKAVLFSIGLSALAGLTFLLMTDDYMREFRFATSFIVLAYISAGLALATLISNLWNQQLWRRILFVTLSGSLLFLTWRDHTPRLNEYAKWPAVNFRRITNEYGTRYDTIADRLGLDRASVLLPDIGGPLYYSHLRVYDLAGLCDRTISRTRGVDQPAFYAYLFDTIQPTFIHTHGFFSYVSRLESDPRFARDYVGIADSLEEYGGGSVIIGDWIRRDQIAGKDSLLRQLQDSLAAQK